MRLLAAAGIGAHHPDGQGCCGAAARHAGAAAQGDALDQANREAFAGAGPVLCLASGCRLHLAGGTTLPVVHPIDFLAEHLE